MKTILLIVMAAALLAGGSSGPSVPNEQLTYSINWPSGLSLGESRLHAALLPASDGAKQRMSFGFDIDAAVPGFAVMDKFTATAGGDFCSTEFDKNIHQGQKRADEKTTFDLASNTATRETKGGGQSKLDTGNCAKDACRSLPPCTSGRPTRCGWSLWERRRSG